MTPFLLVVVRVTHKKIDFLYKRIGFPEIFLSEENGVFGDDLFKGRIKMMIVKINWNK